MKVSNLFRPMLLLAVFPGQYEFAMACAENGDRLCPTAADGKSGWQCTLHAACQAGSEVVSCVRDGEHVWPADGDDNFGWEVVWAFFRKHAKP